MSKRKKRKDTKKNFVSVRGKTKKSKHAAIFRRKKGYKRKIPRLTGKGPGGIPVIEGRVYGKKGDPLDFQISVKVKVPRGRTISARVITEAIRYRIEKGRNPKGFQLKIIRWRNPNRKGTYNGWRTPDDPDTLFNTDKMLGGYARKVSPQHAAWVTLRQALATVQVTDISLG